MRKLFVVLAVSAPLLASPGLSMARGCLKGAAVGGVAGHVAGHHGLVGAAAGCAIGHHRQKVKDRKAAELSQAAAANAAPVPPKTGNVLPSKK